MYIRWYFHFSLVDDFGIFRSFVLRFFFLFDSIFPTRQKLLHLVVWLCSTFKSLQNAQLHQDKLNLTVCHSKWETCRQIHLLRNRIPLSLSLCIEPMCINYAFLRFNDLIGVTMCFRGSEVARKKCWFALIIWLVCDDSVVRSIVDYIMIPMWVSRQLDSIFDEKEKGDNKVVCMNWLSFESLKLPKNYETSWITCSRWWLKFSSRILHYSSIVENNELAMTPLLQVVL